MNHGSIQVVREIVAASIPARSASSTRKRTSGVGSERSRRIAARARVSDGGTRSERGSLIRTAFRSASGNDAPMPITSPTDFIDGPSASVRARELVEVPARQLDDDVVERRLEARRWSRP